MIQINLRGLFRTRQLSLLVVSIFVAVCVPVPAARAGALENYVNQPDASFNWKRCEQKKLKDCSVTHLELVSQTWRGQFWSHHLMVVKPPTVRNADIALLFVTGGSYGSIDDKDLEHFILIAKQAGALACVINKIPNQPLYDGRKEDALIAYTFDQYVKSGDETWPLLFPMVKSAVRGMDTVQAFAAKEFNQKVERFVISGASKRGWTTWLSAAVDPRVKAIAPMVIDTLNMREQLRWAEKFYGRQSEEINDYTAIGFDKKQDDPAVVRIRSWVDPYSYRERYTMPKLLLLGTNDPYWMVDSLRHYWNDLPGPKLIFQTPNAGHDLAGGKEAIQTLAAWFQIIADREELPTMEWQLKDGASGPASVSVKVNRAAQKIRLWSAHSTDRDFRDDKWSSRELEIKPGSSIANAEIDSPEKGFTAFMAEVELKSSTGDIYKLSTQVQVTPDNIKP
ncbi:MAG: PhoPQ-activated pathogenicity-like protein PqaA type [Verrucomicrobia bacterium]|nr:PhoPQ-activated pathogenicity-like protein PqaA type [Verrucomicrobiota bacterium]